MLLILHSFLFSALCGSWEEASLSLPRRLKQPRLERIARPCEAVALGQAEFIWMRNVFLLFFFFFPKQISDCPIAILWFYVVRTEQVGLM